MITLVLTIHIITAILLILTILVQQGRGGGLIESFGGAESIFGTKTSSFFVKLTSILAAIFFLTSFTLAYLSKRQTKSVVERLSSPKKQSTSASSQNNAPVK
ncbi:preprotein translocase subunit SecG [Methanosarcinales archaeon]|nr:MAG: preprotein translocase subunit SecG [Methanosarcinales archaeon]